MLQIKRDGIVLKKSARILEIEKTASTKEECVTIVYLCTIYLVFASFIGLAYWFVLFMMFLAVLYFIRCFVNFLIGMFSNQIYKISFVRHNIFEVRRVFFNMRETGSISAVRNVFSTCWEENYLQYTGSPGEMYRQRTVEVCKVVIQAEKTYTICGLNEKDCNWLVQEIKNWFESTEGRLLQGKDSGG